MSASSRGAAFVSSRVVATIHRTSTRRKIARRICGAFATWIWSSSPSASPAVRIYLAQSSLQKLHHWSHWNPSLASRSFPPTLASSVECRSHQGYVQVCRKAEATQFDQATWRRRRRRICVRVLHGSDMDLFSLSSVLATDLSIG